MINKVTLVGRLTKEVELRKTNSNKSVTTFTLAVNRRFKQEGQPDADFISCLAWNQSADYLAQYSHKGDVVAVSGRIQTRSYEDKNGSKVYVTEVVAEEVSLIGGKKADTVDTKEEVGIIEVVPKETKTAEQVLEETFGAQQLTINPDDLPFY